MITGITFGDYTQPSIMEYYEDAQPYDATLQGVPTPADTYVSHYQGTPSVLQPMPALSKALPDLPLAKPERHSFQDPDFEDQDVPMPEQDRIRNRITKPRFPCPEDSEPPCEKNFCSVNELSKHLTADHDKNVTFSCKHRPCPSSPFETNRAVTWKRHHSTQHRNCRLSEACIEKVCSRERKYWGCGLCETLCKDAKEYAAHYKEHALKAEYRHQSDIKFSTILRSLLKQEATSQRWEERHCDVRGQDGRYLLIWEPESSADLREALEYGIFKGNSIADAGVVDALLDELLTRATYHGEHYVSSVPIVQKPVSGANFQDRLLYAQVQADTQRALLESDCFGPNFPGME